LIAAECRSNIITRKTPRVLELLPNDYPLLIENDNIEDAIETAHSIYNTDAWEYALSVMGKIRDNCSLINHINKYIKILDDLS
jgi:hypothetical protein